LYAVSSALQLAVMPNTLTHKQSRWKIQFQSFNLTRITNVVVNAFSIKTSENANRHKSGKQSLKSYQCTGCGISGHMTSRHVTLEWNEKSRNESMEIQVSECVWCYKYTAQCSSCTTAHMVTCLIDTGQTLTTRLRFTRQNRTHPTNKWRPKCKNPANEPSVWLLRPGHVVGAWYRPGERGDDALEAGPEVDHLKRVVEPASRDAEVRVMRCNMMDTMMTSRQQDVKCLQEHYGTRQAKVRVRPLVNLSHTMPTFSHSQIQFTKKNKLKKIQQTIDNLWKM